MEVTEPGASGDAAGWIAIAVLAAVVLLFAFGMLALSAMLGRRRTGPVKEAAYEAGMTPSGGAHRRFHVRYYLIALIFLLFDVEVVLLFPWAVLVGQSPGRTSPVLLVEMFVFIGILLVGYIYAWRKGALRFD
jgi:NADH-quinone oxidoreductase subunit A